MQQPSIRSARRHDLPGVIETLTAAFDADPLWSWVFDDPARRPEQLRSFWSLLINGGFAQGGIRVTAEGEAAALWIPPGEPELTPEYEAIYRSTVLELAPERSELMLELLDRFEVNHPHDEPHWYLSLLGTRPDMRGHGIGLRLLEDSLAEVDSQAMPAYLEASNPANVALYERYGFEVSGGFDSPGDGPRVVSMWRPATTSA